MPAIHAHSPKARSKTWMPAKRGPRRVTRAGCLGAGMTVARWFNLIRRCS